MKILLIATNQAERYMDRMVVRPLPIGVAYLAAHIDEERHDLRVLDLMFSRDAVADVDTAVTSFRPALVGLSIRNLDNQSFLNPVWHLPAVREIVRRIRAAEDTTIICGGPAFSMLPAECLEYLNADVGFAGDAMESFALAMDRIEDGEEYRDIPGLVYRERDGGRIVVQEGQASSNFSRPPRLDLLDTARYDKAGFGIGVVTKLARDYYPHAGENRQSAGDGWYIRPVDEVVEEIRRLQEDFGIRKLFFIDSGFNALLDHAKALCGALIESGLRIRWNSLLKPGTCDAELLGLMRRSGCSLALMGGLEPASQAGERLSERLEGAQRIAALCRQAGVPFTSSLTFGEPGETEATVNRKLEFLKHVRPDFATLRIGTRVLPGTGLAALAREEGLIGSDRDLLGPTFYVAESVREWIADHLRREAATHLRWNLL